MIYAQILLITGLVFAVLQFLSSRNSARTKAWKKLSLLCFCVLAIVVILFPNLLNDASGLVGVGRGADLLLYVLVVGFIFDHLNNYIKSKDQERKIVVLARRIALLEAEHDTKIKK